VVLGWLAAALAGELIEAGASRRQFGFLDNQNRKAILDLEFEPAALTD
jgi:hypothetical protein